MSYLFSQFIKCSKLDTCPNIRCAAPPEDCSGKIKCEVLNFGEEDCAGCPVCREKKKDVSFMYFHCNKCW